jgi:hypothetical protein
MGSGRYVAVDSLSDHISGLLRLVAEYHEGGGNIWAE